MRNENVVMISELVRDVGEPITANTNYRFGCNYRGKLWETKFRTVGCMMRL